MQKPNPPDNAGHVFCLQLPGIASLGTSAGRKPTCSLPFHLPSAACQQPIQSLSLSLNQMRAFKLKSCSRQIHSFSTGIPQPDKLIAQFTPCAPHIMIPSCSWRCYLFVPNVAQKEESAKDTKERTDVFTEGGNSPKNSLRLSPAIFLFCLANTWCLA